MARGERRQRTPRPISPDPLDILRQIQDEGESGPRIVHIEELPGRDAEYGTLDQPLPERLREALGRVGVDRFYRHQAEAIAAARRGEHVAVITGTASGKTLCYNVPVLERLLADRSSRALYLFPTKALAQDQLRKLEEFRLFPELRAATYDGDTPVPERRAVRQFARLVLTNPDMLHVGILPNHALWSDFLRGLTHVVIDEVHTCHGVFGAHVALLVRRLRRLCAFYQSSPQFLLCSATIANPDAAARDLTGLDCRIIDADSAPRGRRHFVFWNPPLVTAGAGAVRRSTNSETVMLMTRLMAAGFRTIVFATARVTTELLLQYAIGYLRQEAPELVPRLTAYRAGYLPAERREIERRLFSGELLGVTSTSALELGVDIGGLDVSVMAGYPGTISSTWQQAGRAGRRLQDALIVLVARNSAIDQFLMKRPDYFFGQIAERVAINPRNVYVLAAHLLCAAHELPLRAADREIFGTDMEPLLRQLTDGGFLADREGRHFWAEGGRPQDQISLRSASGVAYEIRDVDRNNEVIGTVDANRAFDTVHEGAVYLHRGESYLVLRLDLDQRCAFVRREKLNYYTFPMIDTETSILTTEAERYLPCGAMAKFGQLEVRTRVLGFWRMRHFDDWASDAIDLDLPSQTFETRGLWICLTSELQRRLVSDGFDVMGAMHAAEHATIALVPLVSVCDERDVNGVSVIAHPELGGPVIFVYDGYPGGAGICDHAFDELDGLLRHALRAIQSCECETGCPSCVQSPRCGSRNQPLDKPGAAYLLNMLLDAATMERGASGEEGDR